MVTRQKEREVMMTLFQSMIPVCSKERERGEGKGREREQLLCAALAAVLTQ